MSDVNRLLSIMEQLCQEHQTLLEACRRQEQSLIRNDTEATERAVAAMERCVNRVTELETERQSVAARLAERFGIPSNAITVSALTERLEVSHRQRLTSLAGDLQDLLYEIRTVNQVNDRLVKNALLYVRQTLQIVATTLSEDRYGSGAKSGLGGRLFSAEA